MKRFIYADHAATTKLDMDAFEAMKLYLLDDYANASQPYSISRKTKGALSAARETIAACIHAKPEEIYFTSGGTESDNWAIKGFAAMSDERRILTSEIEHHAILNACKGAHGAECVYLPVDGAGIVSSEVLERELGLAQRQLPTLVSVMLVNNEIGTIEPIQVLAEVAHRYGATVHTDAVQAVGHIPVDVEALDVNMLSASAHKFNGPKGIGFLYVREGTPLSPYMDGGAQEGRMRAGTENVASIVGMAVALQKNCDAMEETGKNLHRLEQIIVEGLREARIDFIRNGAEHRVPGNLSLSFRHSSGEMLLHRLDLMGIGVSTGSACDSVHTQLSHVIQAISVPAEYAEGTIRISLGKENTEADARAIAAAIIKILEKRGM